jgi:hypothetical protein
MFYLCSIELQISTAVNEGLGKMLFTVDADGSPLGVAATATPEAAISLVRALHRAQESTVCELSGASSILARPASRSERGIFERSALSGEVRLAAILL